MNSINVSPSIPGTSAPGAGRAFVEYETWERNYTITGVTRDSTGAALASCTVKLFNTATDALAQTAISDASGNYSFNVDKTQSWYVVSYLAGAPDVAGTSVNTLKGA